MRFESGSLCTSASSIPWQRPSTSAAWIKNSLFSISVIAITSKKKYHTCSSAKAYPGSLLCVSNDNGAWNWVHTFVDFKLSDCLPLVYCYHPFVFHLTATCEKDSDQTKTSRSELDILYLTSMTSLSFPTASTIPCSLSSENAPLGNRYDVTIT